MLTRMLFFKLVASAVIWLLHVSSSVKIHATSLAPDLMMLLANTWLRKTWRADSKFEPPPIRVSDPIPCRSELMSPYLFRAIGTWALVP